MRRVACQPDRFHVVAGGIRPRSYLTPLYFYISGSSDNEGERFSVTAENGSKCDTVKNDTVKGDNSTGYFPWRHETQPTRRLLEKNDLSGMPNNFRARLIRRIVSCREMNVSLFEAIPVPFFVHSWESELVDNFKEAFVLALAELLSTIFQTPVETNEQGVILIDSDKRNKVNVATKPLENDEYLNRMIDKNLLAIYQAVDADKLHLKLSMRPVSATLENIFTVSVYAVFHLVILYLLHYHPHANLVAVHYYQGK